jgi:magnesium chelatase family protein
MARLALLATRESGLRAIVVPHANARDAAVCEGLDVYAVESLPETRDLGNSPESFPSVKVDARLLF